jgi:hypothetical protein
MTAALHDLPCTCNGKVDAWSACATCRAWHATRIAVEHAIAMARRSSRRPSARLDRLEQRVRRLEDARAGW